MTIARKDIHDPEESGFFHCYNRCVRRAFLCGFDRLTGKSYEHRKEWVRSRLAELVDIFAIECLAHAPMDNHLHTVVRNKPEVVASWSDEEVARRWRRLFPRRRKQDGTAEEPNEAEIQEITSRPKRLTDCRRRLSDLSWFYRCLNEYIARKANAEDDCTGRFWDGRFKSQRLETPAAVILCCLYVDLNRIRAGAAKTPEESKYTSIQDRIYELRGHPIPGAPPLASFKDALENGPTVEEYIELVDETGRILKEGKQSIPAHLEPILKRLKIKPGGFLENARSQPTLFRRVVGPIQRLRELAAQKGKAWFQGMRAAQAAFV